MVNVLPTKAMTCATNDDWAFSSAFVGLGRVRGTSTSEERLEQLGPHSNLFICTFVGEIYYEVGHVVCLTNGGIPVIESKTNGTSIYCERADLLSYLPKWCIFPLTLIVF